MTLALDIQNLTKTYASGFTALKGIDLSVQEGDFFALLGPNGAGKSTTIGIITSLVRKTSGSVKVFGHDIDTELAKSQQCIGLVPQEFNFNPFEHLQDLLTYQAGFYGIPRKVAKSRVEYYLKKLELWDKRHGNARELSGGMKRRLMIARAMINEPKLLILDEPTAGVDLEIRRSMWEFIKQINADQGTSIILTTHYLEEAEQLCRNIAIIDEGQVIRQTEMKQLLAQLDVETVVLDVNSAKSGNVPADLTLADYVVKVVDAQTLEVEITAEQGITGVIEALSAKGIRIKSMRNKENRLEALFMRLVSHQPEQHETTAEVAHG